MLFNPLWLRLAPYGACLLLSALCWHFWHRAVENANAVRMQAAQFTQAQHDADREWANKFAAQQTAYDKETEDAQRKEQTILASARDAARARIGLRATSSSGNAQASSAAATPNAPGVPAGLPSDGVLVSADDVRACSDATAYALGAHEWAVSLFQKQDPRPTK